MPRFCISVCLLAALAAPFELHASIIFGSTLTGDISGSPGSGGGSVVVDDGSQNMSVSLSFSGLLGLATFASLNAGGSFPLFIPTLDTSGFLSGTFSIDSSVVSTLRGGGGSFVVGTTEFPGGEISGSVFFITETAPGRQDPPTMPPPVVLIPEASTFALLLVGLGVLALRERLRALVRVII